MTVEVRGAPSATVLLSTAAIRERCGNVAAAVAAGRSRHFRIDPARLDDCAARVTEVTRRRYPDLVIPGHSRWRHFAAGGVDRQGELLRRLAGRSVAEVARAQIDLTVVSVLLDAGAGSAWSYVEAESGQSYARSEGLAVASFRAFVQGAFSARRDDPLRVDANALQRIDAAALARWFQARDDNPLAGLEGRAALLRRLGAALVAQSDWFAAEARPGALFDALTSQAQREIDAEALLYALLEGLGPIWPHGAMIDGVPVGDCWRHPCAGGEGPTAGWVPFHKLSQWLAYSLFEPFEWAGVSVVRRDRLTALPEYRNGGLLLDTGVLSLIDPGDAARIWDIGSELVVEWRALTVALVDALAPRVRTLLEAPDLSLAAILEGGTWAAGREYAQALRGGDPPLKLATDGTVF